MSKKSVLDAYAMIAFFNNEESADKVEELLWRLPIWDTDEYR